MLRLSFPESDYCIAALGSDLKQCAAVSYGKRIHLSVAVSDMTDREDYGAAESHARALVHGADRHP
ncbi:MAG: hypothetical protein Q9M23_03390, partial [Mariprofundaceae bacterium]|nr:hypothetical protein [Mariprofundaceae bacterium]